MVMITRRVLLSMAGTVGGALALGNRVVIAAGDHSDDADVRTYFDARFPRSLQLAGLLPDRGVVAAVGGDPSFLMAQVNDATARRRGLRLQGVTTESVPFCLEQLVRDLPGVRIVSRRIDQDLFEWSINLPLRARTL